MHAMVLNRIGQSLVWTELSDPQPAAGEIRVQVTACGVCRTDLHVMDGELAHPHVPIVPGHEIVGRIDVIGAGVTDRRLGERVGIPWLSHTCGVCPYCVMHHENLCDQPLFTGYARNGGFATAAFADARFALGLGAIWAGGSDMFPPHALNAAIIFAPVGALVPLALKAVRKGGRVVCAGIHMSDIPNFLYALLWEERQLLSVANLTRQDGLDFMQQANTALSDLRAGRFDGAAVLIP